MDIKEKLEKSIQSGEILEIIYYGGSYPGKLRKVQPIKIDGNKLIAKCLSSNEVKTFSISKIAVQENGLTLGANSSALEFKSLFNFEDLITFLTEFRNELENMGWFITSENNSYLALHSFFKNGKPKKTPDISILYSEYSEEIVYDSDRNEFINVRKKMQKPWSVRAINQTTRTYAKLNSALETFITFAKSYSPRENEHKN